MGKPWSKTECKVCFRGFGAGYHNMPIQWIEGWVVCRTCFDSLQLSGRAARQMHVPLDMRVTLPDGWRICEMLASNLERFARHVRLFNDMRETAEFTVTREVQT